MIFALSAPAMAVVTFMLLVWNGSSNPVEKVNFELRLFHPYDIYN